MLAPAAKRRLVVPSASSASSAPSATAAPSALTALDALAAVLDRADPGQPVDAPGDQVAVVVGDSALVFGLARLRGLVDRLAAELAVHAATTVDALMVGRAWSHATLAAALHHHLGVPVAHATTVAAALPAAWYACGGRSSGAFDLSARTRPLVVAAIIRPLVADLCRAWPDDSRRAADPPANPTGPPADPLAVPLAALSGGLRAWMALWAPTPASRAAEAAEAAGGQPGGADPAAATSADDRHGNFLRELDNELPRSIRGMRRRAGKWRECPPPVVDYGMLPVADVQTAIANISRKCTHIQRVDDPTGPRWLSLSNRDDLVTLYKDQPIRRSMETYVADHAGGSMLVTRDASALLALSPDTVLRITPRAVDQLGRAIQDSAEPPAAFIDISLSTMVHILAERAGPPGLDAAKAHLHAYLALLGPARCDFDGEVDLMASRCDLRVLAEMQALRDDVRASEQRLMASQERLALETLAGQERLQAAQEETRACQQRMQGLLEQIAERADSNPPSPHMNRSEFMDLLNTHQEETIAKIASIIPHTRRSPRLSVQSSPAPAEGAREGQRIAKPRKPVEASNPRVIEGCLEIGLPESYKMSATDLHELFATHPDRFWRNHRTRADKLRSLNVSSPVRNNRSRYWKGIRPYPPSN